VDFFVDNQQTDPSNQPTSTKSLSQNYLLMVGELRTKEGKSAKQCVPGLFSSSDSSMILKCWHGMA
jgi:hypothetical protein